MPLEASVVTTLPRHASGGDNDGVEVHETVGLDDTDAEIEEDAETDGEAVDCKLKPTVGDTEGDVKGEITADEEAVGLLTVCETDGVVVNDFIKDVVGDGDGGEHDGGAHISMARMRLL
jgi:hypothetical protein